jgi:hypothetical protein
LGIFIASALVAFVAAMALFIVYKSVSLVILLC